MSDFINNPSRNELIKNLQLVVDIDNYIAGGYSITIEAEGSDGEDSASVITMDDLVTEEFFEELEKAYPDMRDTLAECLSDADMETRDELFGYYGEASSARVNLDPLVFDMGNGKPGTLSREKLKKFTRIGNVPVLLWRMERQHDMLR